MRRFRAIARVMPWAVVAASGTSAAMAGPPARILFVRGADRSGGFLEGGGDFARTEQLSDITNAATNGGNHGWFELAEALRGAGYEVQQVLEPLEADAPPTGPTEGAPLDFAALGLDSYDAVVMGSNNAAYPPDQVDVFESYIRRGGAALFISDANFGGSWADAPTSDQFFLDRFGWVMQQDRGTYALRRNDGDFLVPGHPVLVGVDAFDGEGVSPIVLPEQDTAPGVASTIVVRAMPGASTRNNDNFPGQGSSRPVGPQDAALAVAFVDSGRIAGHLDRNTFFNQNGAGTNINRLDNRLYALNLFAWLTDGPGIPAECSPADINGDGTLTFADVTAFVDAFGAAEPAADVDGDGLVTFADVTEFIDRFNAGCP